MNKKIKIYIAAALLVVLNACSISKDIAKPVGLAPDHFRNEMVADTAGIGEIPWKDFFTDPSLQKLIDSAIVKNYDMQVALKNTEAAQLVLGQTKYAYLPSVNLQAGVTVNRPSDNSLNGLSLGQFLGRSYLEDYTTSFGVSWEADIWGKIKNKKAAALAEYLQTNEAVKAVQTNIVAGIANGYYTLLMLDAQLDVAKKNVLLNDSTINMIRLQYQAGQVTGLAIQQSEAQRLSALQLVPQIEQEIAIQENAISLLTGIFPQRTQRNILMEEVAVPANVATGIPSQALGRRPDVKRFELELIVANARTGIAKANMYPSVSITAASGVNAFKAANWFSIPASLFGTIAGNITAPLFQRKELETKYKLMEVEREKNVIQFRQAVLYAVGEVSDALVKVEKLKQQQTITSARRDTLQNSILNARLLFKNGMATYLEVLSAQANALQTELEVYTIKKAQLSANINLYRALGGGWK
jgi:multidrug efflux system outer membrane protein